MLTLIMESALIVVLYLKKKPLTSEEGRAALKKKSRTALYIVGLLLVSLFFQIIAEADEILEMTVPGPSEIFRYAASIHLAFLLLALFFIVRLTYAMGWER
ncbi:MAG: hypothetical protein D6733_04340 [Methanobacteriota archaeon]|nr:MAG: hypothetical protein D6733_04340 [Euryarchaeota archaeon]